MRVIEQAARAAAETMVKLWIERNPNGGQLGGWESESDEFRSGWIAAVEAALEVVRPHFFKLSHFPNGVISSVLDESPPAITADEYVRIGLHEGKVFTPPPLPDERTLSFWMPPVFVPPNLADVHFGLASTDDVQPDAIIE